MSESPTSPAQLVRSQGALSRRLSCSSTPIDLSASIANTDDAAASSNRSVALSSSAASVLDTADVAPSNAPSVLFFNAVASTRKVLLALPLSMPDLRLAFATEMQMDLSSLPPLYIRDRHTNIEYELQSADDVYPMAFLTVRQTQQHIPAPSVVHTITTTTTTTTNSTSSTTNNNNNQSTPQTTGVPAKAASYMLESMLLRRQKLVLVLVGKPACGKTFVATKLARYLNWNALPTKVFSVGDHRRAKFGFRSASFYDPANVDGVQSREALALETLDQLISFLIGSSAAPAQGMAAIFDANNSTLARRRKILERLASGGITPSEVMFLEILKSDTSAPDVGDADLDYNQLAADDARVDLDRRLKFYSAAYEPLDFDAPPPAAVVERPMLVQVWPEDHRINARDVRSHVAQRLVNLLLNVGTRKRKFWFSRHGESLYNLTGRLGGNSDLSEKGHSYAKALCAWFEQNVDKETRDNMLVVTSTLVRTIATSRHFACEKLHLRSLDEIDAGVCDGMTYDGIAREYPEEAKARAVDKYHYRYPRGESYVDVVQRLEPVLLELERVERPVLIISHQAIMRVLVSYFRDIAPEKIPHMDMPLHTLVEITPSVGTLQMKEYKLVE